MGGALRGRIHGGVLLFLGALFLSGGALAADVYVNASSSSSVEDGSAYNPYHAITPALAAAKAGDTVRVAPGTYSEHFELKDGVRLVSQKGPSLTIIDGGGMTDRVIWMPNTVNNPTGYVEGFTVRNRGGGVLFYTTDVQNIWVNPFLHIHNCILEDAHTGLVAYPSSNTLLTRTLFRNLALAVEGIWCAPPTLVNVTIDGMGTAFRGYDIGFRVYNSTITNVGTVVEANGGAGGQRLSGTNNNFWNYTYGSNNPAVPFDAGLAATMNVDPLFEEPPSDYRLRIGSPLIDAGVPVAEDPGPYKGTAPDVGAYETIAAVIHVDANAAGPSHDGTSWATAFLAVQEGVNAAAPGQEVWVARGTYAEHIELPDNVALFGGFAGTETVRAQRNWVGNETVLDGSSNGIVVSQTGGGEATRVDGFTIRNGYTVNIGGGIIAGGSAMTIANNLIRNNRADFTGGGISLYNSLATVKNNRIAGNTGGTGAGLAIIGGNPRIVNNRIEGNEAEDSGGGLLFWTGNATVTGNVFAANTAGGTGVGHAIVIDTDQPVSIVNNTFDGTGTKHPYGVAIYQVGPGQTFANNIVAYFRNGISTYRGTLRNNGFFGNYQDIDYNDPSFPSVGDIVADPLFNDRAAGDYHLKAGSAMIDAGGSTLVQADWTDMDGEPRVYPGGPVDIGADEFSYPATELSAVGTAGGNGWYITPVEVTLVASDGPGGAGIAATYYSLDAGVNWNTYAGPFPVSPEGSTRIDYYSSSNGGRVEAVRQSEIRIDLAPPVTSPVLAGTAGQNGWFLSDVVVALSASGGAGSGVARTEYSLDGTTWSRYTAPVTLSSEGVNQFSYRSQDVAGNLEAAKVVTVPIDKTAPVTGATLAGTAGENGWYVSPVRVTISAKDAASGVSRTEYLLDNGAWTLYARPFTISANGTHTLQVRSTDAAGNPEAARAVSIQIDRTAPRVTATDPRNGATGIVLGKTVTVTFSEAIQAGAAYSGITITSGRTRIPFTPGVSGNVLTLDPASNLPRNSTITVTLPAGAVKDAAGNRQAAAYSFGFRTGNR